MTHIATGFSQPVFGAQSAFRSIMEAFSFPGRIVEVQGPQEAPTGWPSSLAAACLTLLDNDVSIWLDHEDPETIRYLNFHSGCRITSQPNDADFAVILDPESAPFQQFKIGTDKYPDRSATLLVACQSLSKGPVIEISGPGIKEKRRIEPMLEVASFWAAWATNNALYPLGFDVCLFTGNLALALPRGVSAHTLEV
ncbi:MAG: phosphonate C-P lyase system protein PhnH [Rhodospirillales bacterium]|jgi:alpha-D-ribose 1-methylphosphonate 5-triphosphate synthase subunit PhnH